MSFDQDPSEEVVISGADFAMMTDEITTLRSQLAEAQARIKELEEAAKVQGEPVAWAIHVEGDTDSEITWDSIWDHPQFANDHINQQYELQADGYLPKCKRSVVPLYTHPAPSTEKVSQEPTMGAKMPNGVIVTNVYEAFEEGKRSANSTAQAAVAAALRKASEVCRLWESGDGDDFAKQILAINPEEV